MDAKLRILDAGTLSPLRSQALWHGLADASHRDAPPTLSFCRPAAPYVGLGYHRRLAEIDLDACRRLGLPVIRRRIGGGPVYLDGDQLFFQVTLGADRAPARVDRLYERYLEPAAEAFRRLGLDVRRRGLNDLAVGRRKVSGTGAGRIGDGVTVVGNVLFRFPHERMVETLALPTGTLREECLRLMRRHVTTLEAEGLRAVSFDEARRALVASYSEALHLGPVPGELERAEENAVRRWEERFEDREWLAGPSVPEPPFRQVKISSDAWVVAAAAKGWTVEASVAEGRLEKVAVGGEGGSEIARALTGLEAQPDALRRALGGFGGKGREVLALLEPGLRLR